MTRTDRILATEIGDYPDLDFGIVPNKRAMYDCVKWYLNMLVLPPQGTVNKCCKYARHGIAYRSVNKTNKGNK